MTTSIGREKTSAQDGAGRRNVWLAATVVVVFNVLLVSWMLLQPAGPRVSPAVSNAGGVVGPLFALFLCFLGFRAASRTEDRPAATTGWRWAPLLLGAGILSYIVGRIVFNYYVWVLDRLPPMPSYATIGFLGQYPLLLAGILLMLPARTSSGASRARVALDGLMVMTATVTFSWYFFLGPVVQRGSETVVMKTFATAYPLADIMLVASLLILVLRAGGRAFGGAVPLLAVGLVLIVITDGAYGYQRINDLYSTGTLIDAGWPIGYMLLGLAAYLVGLSPATTPDEPADDGPTAADQRLWLSLLPYALVPAVILLAVYA